MKPGNQLVMYTVCVQVYIIIHVIVAVIDAG